jgi:hypothetical protein
MKAPAAGLTAAILDWRCRWWFYGTCGPALDPELRRSLAILGEVARPVLEQLTLDDSDRQSFGSRPGGL